MTRKKAACQRRPDHHQNKPTRKAATNATYVSLCFAWMSVDAFLQPVSGRGATSLLRSRPALAEASSTLGGKCGLDRAKMFEKVKKGFVRELKKSSSRTITSKNRSHMRP